MFALNNAIEQTNLCSTMKHHLFPFYTDLTHCFLYITRMRYFRPSAGKDEKKRTEISISLTNNAIHKYVQL